MENLKIPNNSKTEEQVLNLLEQLGYFRLSGAYGSEYLFANGNDETIYSNDEEERHIYQLLTLDQLQDKVVLHRNDVNDATHDDVLTRKALKLSEWYLWNYEEKVWVKHDFGCEFSKLKPIQKPHSDLTTEMSEVKEYLDPEDNYSYHKVPAIAQGTDWIEIPNDADLFFMEWFYKNIDGAWYVFNSKTSDHCVKTDYYFTIESVNIHWVREGIQLPIPNKSNHENLISCANALIAIAYGKQVQYRSDEHTGWQNNIANLKISDFGSGHYEFRFKPKPLIIGDIEVPAPVSPDTQALPEDTDFWIADPSRHDGEFTRKLNWDGALCDRQHLKRGLVHLTKADAIAHVKALILVSGGSIE